MRATRLLSAALAAALLTTACDPAADGAADHGTAQRKYGAIAFEPCSLTSPVSTESIEAQCARYTVAEDPAQPQGRKIALNIAWLPATDESATDADPVFFLAGGPGQAATEVWPQIDRAFREVRKHRNVILIDQRGTGNSNPLVCRDSEGRSAVVDAAEPETDTAAFAQRCLAQLDADPRFYSTTDAVRDLENVRAALGVEQINLVGGSYGTRVAQQYALRHPDHVRTMVLDGVVPNTLVLGSEHARNLDESLALQFARCQQIPACRERFGDDVRGQLRTLMARLAGQPVEVEFRDPTTGALQRETLTSDTVAGLTRMFAYAPHAAALLPLVLNEASQGRYQPLMALAHMIQNQVTEQIMHGMQLSVLCAEDAGELRENPADEDTVLGNGLATLAVEQCKVWPKGARPADFRTPLKSDIPTLLLSGEFDPVTPPRYGEQVLAGLSNGRHLVLKGQGHITAGVGCMPKLLGQFLESADAKALDVKCLDSVDYVPPFTGFNGWEP
jgi:pimeloyl-ACP methyl ester carboxylesterase